MKRQFILRDPDPTGTAGGTGDPTPTPAPGKKPDPTPPTSAEQAAQGKTPKEVALEKRVSTLEDEQNSLKGQLKAATDWIAEKVKATPTPAKESLLDEVNHFLGCGT